MVSMGSLIFRISPVDSFFLTLQEPNTNKMAEYVPDGTSKTV
jgi:hypothetical protein